MSKRFIALVLALVLVSLCAQPAFACTNRHTLWGTMLKKKVVLTLDDGTTITLPKNTQIQKTGWTSHDRTQIYVIGKINIKFDRKNGGLLVVEDSNRGKIGYVQTSKLKTKRVRLVQCKCISR